MTDEVLKLEAIEQLALEVPQDYRALPWVAEEWQVLPGEGPPIVHTGAVTVARFIAGACPAAIIEAAKGHRALRAENERLRAEKVELADEAVVLRARIFELEGDLRRLEKVERAAMGFAETAEAAVAHHRGPKGGQHVPFYGDFANVPPSAIGRLDWWARRIRQAAERMLAPGGAALGFTVTHGPPTRIRTFATDGREWVLSAVFVILGVKERETRAKDGSPWFDVDLQISIAKERSDGVRPAVVSNEVAAAEPLTVTAKEGSNT